MDVIAGDLGGASATCARKAIAQRYDEQGSLDLNSNQPPRTLNVTAIGGGHVERMELAFTPGVFPNGLGHGPTIVPQDLVTLAWDNNDRPAVVVRAKSANATCSSAEQLGDAS